MPDGIPTPVPATADGSCPLVELKSLLGFSPKTMALGKIWAFGKVLPFNPGGS